MGAGVIGNKGEDTLLLELFGLGCPELGQVICIPVEYAGGQAGHKGGIQGVRL